MNSRVYLTRDGTLTCGLYVGLKTFHLKISRYESFTKLSELNGSFTCVKWRGLELAMLTLWVLLAQLK